MRLAPVLVLAFAFAQPMSASPLDTTDYHALRTASGDCLDGAIQSKPLVLGCQEGGESQQWKLTPLKNSYYQLTTKGAGPKRCLDIINDQGSNNRLRLTDCANATGQHWKFTPAGGDAFSLTTEWRGDKKCLAVVNDGDANTPVLADCANVPGQHWKFNREATRAGTKFDGEIAVPSTFAPTFVMLFVHDCPLDLSEVHGDAALFECRRTDKKAVTCTIRNAESSAELWRVNKEPQHALEAVIATDTASALNFATPVGALQVKTNLKSKAVVLTQRSVTCKGNYLTPAQWTDMKKELRAGDTTPATSQSQSSDDSSAPSRPAATPTRQKGLDRGRMCGRDSECESGSCKMENRTRGRCN